MKQLFKWIQVQTQKDIGGLLFDICPYCQGKKKFYDRGYGDNTQQAIECIRCGWRGLRKITYKSDSYRKCYFEKSILKHFSTQEVTMDSKLEIKNFLNKIVFSKDIDNNISVKLYKNFFQTKPIYTFSDLYINWKDQTIKCIFDGKYSIAFNFKKADNCFKFCNIYINDTYTIFDAKKELI